MDEKYEKVIEGAYRIFIEHGIRNISMDDLCRMMGISKKTLYQIVENKTDLLNKISSYIQKAIKERFIEIKEKNLNAIDFLLEMSKISSENHFKINPVVTFEFRKYYPQVYEEYMTCKKEMILENIMQNIDQGIKEGLYRHDLNKEIVAHLYFQKIEDFQNMSKEEIQDFSYTKIFEVMFENHIRGISNQKGIEYFEKQKAKLNFNI
ncbi:MAG: TetR/AcrR family transcriptional regulator [Bacteroidetes bacterium]|nr:TetR/AcrR family transcriptional regulator [Bacteroidota bacterium]